MLINLKKPRMSLKSKLMLMFLLVSICSMLTITYFSFESGKASISEKIFNQLTGLRNTRSEQITTYFNNLRNQGITLSQDVRLINAMKEFKTAYQELEKSKLPSDAEQKISGFYRKQYLKVLAKTEDGNLIPQLFEPRKNSARYLQYYYIASNQNPIGKKYLLNNPGDGSNYSKIHELYHQRFRRIIERYHYEDILLIEPKSGDIVYTAVKQPDFATNLLQGQYNRSHLAKLVKDVIEAKEYNNIQLVDFHSYRPAYGMPVAFLAAPIFEGKELLGVLAIQISGNEINKIVTNNNNWTQDGLGKTGKVYLVAPDLTMRSISRFFVEDPEGFYKSLRSSNYVLEDEIEKIKVYGTTITVLKLDSKLTRAAVEGKQGTRVMTNYRNILVLSSYAPLKIGNWQWGILAEMDLKEAYKPVYEFQKEVVSWGALLIVITTIAATVISGNFIKPINTLISNARKISKGELDGIEKINSKDEFGELARAFNTMVVSLQEQTNRAEQKNRENEELLNSIFPAAIAKKLKEKQKDIGDRIPNVTILFADIIGFSKLYKSLPPEEVLSILNDLVNQFDEINEKYGLDKVKTIGDNYIAACGISGPKLDHAKRTVDFALEMRNIVRRFNQERCFNLDIAIVITSGEVMVGVVGRKKFTYDVWGNPVSIGSSILASNKILPGAIVVSSKVRDSLEDIYSFEQLSYLEVSENQKIVLWYLASTVRSTSL